MIICLVAAGCSKSDRGPVAAPYTGPPIVVAFICGGENDPFWSAVQAGAEQATKELGSNIDLRWSPPPVADDVDSQMEVFKNAVEQKLDGVIISPSNSDALATVIRNAVNDGMGVVAIDRGLDGAKTAARVSSDHYQSGQIAADRIAESIGEQGNVILLRYQIGNDNMEQRAKGVLEGLRKYKNINIVSSDQRGGPDALTAETKVNELLLIFGEQLAGIVVVDQSNASGTLAALRSAELAGSVRLVAFDPNDDLVKGLDDDSCSGIVLQDPFEMGYLSVLTLVDSLSGKKVDPFVPSATYLMTLETQHELLEKMPEYLSE